MPRSSRSSSSSSSGSRSSGGSSRSYTDRRLPRTTAVKALVYLTGQDPRKITGVRVYNYDDFETNSYGSGFSGSSWSSQNSQIYLLESRHMHWYGEDDASYHGSYRAKKPKPASGRSSKQGVRDAWSGQQQYNPKTRRHATVEEDDEEEDDEDDYSDSSSNASAHEFAAADGTAGRTRRRGRAFCA
ncbi:hypothetical protein B0H67DRAFT_330639 [Lasiosphaeris hirsuta]|uniref:Uncharacterized protein n=1 Tax=Lasiosphaeris hirsuta TaxID=260670 RepID=A0AA40A2S3_9PEZI|nr:hypothetical protein B0H67DRAFT_330639 [Lasiosphaeris hirsuta]